MTRYALLLLAALVSLQAAAVLHAAPHGEATVGANQTVIVKNSPFPVIGPIQVEACAVEDCSDATF